VTHLVDAPLKCSGASAKASGSPGPLGTRFVRGALWTILCNVGTKLATLAGQVIAAWFLIPDDFGLLAVALSITCVGATFVGTGVLDVLLQREKHFQREVGHAFWLSLMLNTVGALLLCALAPLAATIFGEPRLVPVIVIIVLCWPINAFLTIYVAALYRDLKFKTVASIRLLQGLVHAGGVVVLAICGLGVYALVLPNLLRIIGGALAARLAGRRIPVGRPQPRLWLGVMRPALRLMLNAFLRGVQYYGPSFAVGIVRGSVITGICFWGFQLSSQSLLILCTNLRGVLFPTLTRLNGDSQRQYRGFQKACRALTIVIAPICLLQMLLAAPLIQLVFPSRWLPAVDVIVWLSFGMLTQPLFVLATSLLLARGEYRTLNLTAGLATVGVVAAAFLGSLLGGAAQISAWMGSAYLVTNLVTGWIAFRQFDLGWSQLFRTIILPLALAAAAGTGTWLVGATIQGYGMICEILFTSLLMSAFYVGLLFCFIPQETVTLLRQAVFSKHGDRSSTKPPTAYFGARTHVDGGNLQ